MSKSRKRALFKVGAIAVLLTFVVLFSLMAGSQDKGTSEQQHDSKAARLERQAKILKQIEQMRAEIKANGWDYTVGPNPAMQYSLEKLGGFNPDLKPDFSMAIEPGESENELEVLGKIPTLPSSYLGYYTGIKDQQHDLCGSCWAFATIGNLEAAIKRITGTDYDLSEQHLVSCNPWNWGCDGGGFAYDFLMPPYSQGAIPEECFRYAAAEVPCIYCGNHPWFPVAQWGFLAKGKTIPSVATIKNAIYKYGSVSTSLWIDNLFRAYTGGVFTTNMVGPIIGHAAILCGWDDSKQAWRLKNSWGTNWGEAGFMWIKYGCPNQVGKGASWVIPLL